MGLGELLQRRNIFDRGSSIEIDGMTANGDILFSDNEEVKN